MYLKIVFPPLLQQFWSVWNDWTHVYKSLVFGDECLAHLKSHQRCSAAFILALEGQYFWQYSVCMDSMHTVHAYLQLPREAQTTNQCTV